MSHLVLKIITAASVWREVWDSLYVQNRNPNKKSHLTNYIQ